MATSLISPYASKTFPAASASLTQFQFVQVTSTGTIQTPATSGVYAWVLNDAPALSGATITNDMPTGGFVVGAYYTCVAPHLSMVKVISGATMSANQAVQTDASGHAVPLVTGGTVLGYTVAASNSGDIVALVP